MNQREQTQLAFEICDRIARLESALWDQYYEEFLDILMGDPNEKDIVNDSLDDEIF